MTRMKRFLQILLVGLVSTLMFEAAWSSDDPNWFGEAVEEDERLTGIDPTLPAVLFPFTLGAVIVLVVPIIGLLVSRLSFERERAEDLLLNVLPAEVASELKETGATATRGFSSISVLFADIVGFTPMSADMEPDEMVGQLNEVFSHFDAFGEPVEAPERWGSINSFFIRARNRLSRRVRANLFDGETYQTQVFLQSYNGFDEEVKEEAKQRYLEIREIWRQRFKEKRAAENES